MTGKHGVYSTYSAGGCRCDLCREAQRRYQAAYRAKVGNERGKAVALARQKAMERLADMYPAQMRRLHIEECSKAGIVPPGEYVRRKRRPSGSVVGTIDANEKV